MTPKLFAAVLNDLRNAWRVCRYSDEMKEKLEDLIGLLVTIGAVLAFIAVVIGMCITALR